MRKLGKDEQVKSKQPRMRCHHEVQGNTQETQERKNAGKLLCQDRILKHEIAAEVQLMPSKSKARRCGGEEEFVEAALEI